MAILENPKVILLNWRNRNLKSISGTNIYRSNSSIDPDNLPSPYAFVEGNVEEFVDYDVDPEQTYYYRIEAVSGDERKLALNEVKIWPYGIIPGPGSNELIGGDMNAGFAGEVPVSELFTGDELAGLIGLSAGTSQHSNEPWLKFVLDGEILYVAKKPYRHSVNWNHINNVNAVYNNESSQVVNKNGYDFRVTLLRGANEDPSSAIDGDNPEGTELSEWNRLMYKAHVDDPSGEPWANYTNADIIVGGTANGRASWCQETNQANSGQRVYRGSPSLVRFNWSSSSLANTNRGWRPALRLLI